MKNKNYLPLYLSVSALIMIGCRVRIPSETTPKPEFYGSVDQINTTDGFPVKPEPWVVVSDRDNNTVYMDKGDERSPKEIKFLEPLLVVKRNTARGLVKVAEYNPDALMRRLPAKSVKTYGWIPESQLLLWTNSIKNKDNGFSLKAALAPGNADVLKNAEKYLKNDSVLVFTSPDLTKTAPVKLPVGELVYIYKHAEDGKRFLIGKSPSVKIDSIPGNMYGWVSANMVGVWGDRTGLRVSPDYTYTEQEDIGLHRNVTDGTSPNIYFRLSEAAQRTPKENLVGTWPAEAEKHHQARFFSNALDYSKNFVYNVLGEQLSYDRYKEITNKNKNLNIVFTLDISNENRQNTAVAKSAFQDMQQKMKSLGYYRNIRFGAVLYKYNSCGENVVASELSPDLVKIAQFIDEKTAQDGCSSYGGQPMQEGLAAAGQLLSPYRDDTNIVVLVGATASQGAYIGDAVGGLSLARARIVSYQTVAGASDNYNNFVLLSESIVTNTARNIAEMEKARSIDQNSVMNRNNYNIQQGEEGIYSLDYPKTAMSQGFVIYPKKGEINSNAHLAKSLDSLLAQVTHQNRETDRSLTAYFQSPIGASKTELKPDYRPQFPNAPALIPVEAAAQLVVYGNPFLVKGYYTDEFKDNYPAVEKGILVSEKEFDRLKSLYNDIYMETRPYSDAFSQSRAVDAYLKVLKKYSLLPGGFSRSALLEKSMAYSVALSTGFDNAQEEVLTKYTLSGWRKGKIVPQPVARTYFNQYKALANRLLENKVNSKIIIEQNGEKFYWLNAYFMPLTTPQENL